MKIDIRLIIFVCIFTLEWAAGPIQADMDGMNMSPSSIHDYSAKGMIEKIASDKKTVSIENEDIPGYMKSMTMDYVVKTPTELSGIKVGDKITFTLEAADSGLLAKDIKKSN